MSKVVRLPVQHRADQLNEQGAPDGALHKAMRELAAFKFKLIETVAADPLLRNDERLKAAPCTAAIIVLLSYVTIDRRTMKPTEAYASKITLMVRGGMTESAAKRARRLLVANGYLVGTGTTKDGCVLYRVENPHAERVDMHAREAAQYLKEQAAERRKEERRKVAHPLLRSHVGGNRTPAEIACGDPQHHDVGGNRTPNYLRGYLGDISSEGEAFTEDGHKPFPAPASEAEAVAALNEIDPDGKLSPGVARYFQTALMAGRLTPAMVAQQREFAP